MTKPETKIHRGDAESAEENNRGFCRRGDRPLRLCGDSDRQVSGYVLLKLLVFSAALLLPVVLWRSGWLLRAHADLFVWALDRWGPCAVERTGETTFTSGNARFVVVHWCTPLWIWIGALVMLLSAGSSSARSIIWAAGLTLAALVASTANVVAGVWIVSSFDIGWSWAHIPGTFVIYTGSFIVCLYVALRTPGSRRLFITTNHSEAQMRNPDPQDRQSQGG